jgi:hypothetical protein
MNNKGDLSTKKSMSGSPTSSMSSFTPPSRLLLLTTGISPSTQLNDETQQQIIHANINNIKPQNIINVDSRIHMKIYFKFNQLKFN